MKQVNCAIYVRKSTEKGLGQEFNSLDNQEQACKSYIDSRVLDGWTHHKTYCDAGISGGTTKRPELQQMLADIRKGEINAVIVYKIDRLSRSTLDFGLMLKELNKHECDFVSTTQHFDTSTALGKAFLGLTMLFAELEMNMASDRVKDKIRASRAKGMWTGGCPNLGYDVINKKLIINPTEAETVITIYKKYLELGAVNELFDWALANDVRGKKWINAKEETVGGNPIARNTLHKILRNPLYIGKMPSKAAGEIHDGLHDAIIATDVFNDVQKMLDENNQRKTKVCLRGKYLLDGKVEDIAGAKFRNAFTSKSAKRQHRYYYIKGRSLPAADVEQITKDTISGFLDADLGALALQETIATFKSVNFADTGYEEQTKILSHLIEKVVYHESKLSFYVRISPLPKSCLADGFINRNNSAITDKTYLSADGQFIIIEKEIVLNRRCSTNQYEACGNSILTKTENNDMLIRALAYGRRYQEMYENGVPVEHIIKQENIAHRTVYKYLNLAYLSPIIVDSVLSANVPTGMDLQKLFKIASAHVDFDKQESAYFGNL